MALGLLVGCGPATQTASGPAATPAAVATTARPEATATRPNAERVSGTVMSISGGRVTTAEGASFTVSDQTRVIRQEPATKADLQPGLYVAITAKRQPDNTLLATIVNVFPEAMRNTAPGQRPMDLGNLMTNATIDTVKGDGFTVAFPGGGAMVKLAPDAQIGKFAIGTVADLKEGGTVSALVNNGAAQSVSLR